MVAQFFHFFLFSADKLNFSRWMENLPGRFHSVPLTDLAIPGSHDSCSYSLSSRSSYSIGLDSKVSAWGVYTYGGDARKNGDKREFKARFPLGEFVRANKQKANVIA